MHTFLGAVLGAAVTLAWDPSPDAVAYRVYVSIPPVDGDKPLLWYATGDTQYEVTGLEFGTAYYFRATAFNSSGCERRRENRRNRSV
jgi:hypothetical protein